MPRRWPRSAELRLRAQPANDKQTHLVVHSDRLCNDKIGLKDASTASNGGGKPTSCNLQLANTNAPTPSLVQQPQQQQGVSAVNPTTSGAELQLEHTQNLACLAREFLVRRRPIEKSLRLVLLADKHGQCAAWHKKHNKVSRSFEGTRGDDFTLAEQQAKSADWIADYSSRTIFVAFSGIICSSSASSTTFTSTITII